MSVDKSGLTLVVLAAGMGSRFGGLKQLERLGPGGHVLPEYTLYDAIRAGFRRIVFVIQSGLEDRFAALFDSLPRDVSVHFAPQDQCWPEGVAHVERAKPWGTGHALLAAKDYVRGPFALVNADDYYGSTAFARAADFLASRDAQSVRYGLLGYRLDGTLSSHGSVSRAVCVVSGPGRLQSVCEHTRIARSGSTIEGVNEDGETVALDPAQRVSMNFWLLTPSVFGFLDSAVRVFIERHRHDATAECQLPDIVNGLMQRAEITVDCLAHDGKWFGLTHRADYKSAVSAIARLHDEGRYPTPLWPGDDTGA